MGRAKRLKDGLAGDVPAHAARPVHGGWETHNLFTLWCFGVREAPDFHSRSVGALPYVYRLQPLDVV